MLSLKSKSFNAILCDFQTVEEKEVETPSQPLDLGFPDDDDDANSPEGCTYTGFFFLSISVDVFLHQPLNLSLCLHFSLSQEFHTLRHLTGSSTSLSLHLLCVETYLSHIIISESNPHQRPLAVFKQLFIYIYIYDLCSELENKHDPSEILKQLVKRKEKNETRMTESVSKQGQNMQEVKKNTVFNWTTQNKYKLSVQTPFSSNKQIMY